MGCCGRSFESATLINAPPSTVYAILTDFDAYNQWNAVIPAIRVKEFKENAAIRPTLVSSRGKISFNASLNKVDPAKKEFSWKAGMPIPGMFKGIHSFIMHPADDAGASTRLVRREEYSGLLVPLFASQVRDADAGLEEMIQALKKRAEESAHPPPIIESTTTGEVMPAGEGAVEVTTT